MKKYFDGGYTLAGGSFQVYKNVEGALDENSKEFQKINSKTYNEKKLDKLFENVKQ